MLCKVGGALPAKAVRSVFLATSKEAFVFNTVRQSTWKKKSRQPIDVFSKEYPTNSMFSTNSCPPRQLTTELYDQDPITTKEQSIATIVVGASLPECSMQTSSSDRSIQSSLNLTFTGLFLFLISSFLIHVQCKSVMRFVISE